MFAVNPFRHIQDGVATIERNVQRFDEVPDKVVVDQESFLEKQQREMSILKSDSEGMKDEIHD